ncbi:hypothetical protein BKA93DRAFT_886963 [Sparassis latifolia]
MSRSNEHNVLTLAYYCSGHGYGHATRVSAFACHLLCLDPPPVIHIVSSAPKHVFSASIAKGALYRYAEIDPVIVQPLAYRVDRRKSVDVLESFLQQKDGKLLEESRWLLSIDADCVLSDAAFLGCLAANQAGLPSVLVTNFSFDSVYSYLSTSFVEATSSLVVNTLQPQSPQSQEDSEPDVPILLDKLAPLVDQLHSGYRCADLLLRLPGAIPIPSFAVHPHLPSVEWVDSGSRTFTSDVQAHLMNHPSEYSLYSSLTPGNAISRTVVSAPLLVRSPDSSIYSSAGRSRLLESIRVPPRLHDPNHTKILIVSFGGQVFHKPVSHSRTPSGVVTPSSASTSTTAFEGAFTKSDIPASRRPEGHAQALKNALRSVSSERPPCSPNRETGDARPSVVRRISGRLQPLSQLNIAGAPPATVPTSPIPVSIPIFTTVTIPASPVLPSNSATNGDGTDTTSLNGAIEDGLMPRLLPDESWIAIVCGVSKEWGTEDGDELPENFFVAPKDVYMPDLTAVADVLLGKLGYGTVSECVDACTPFVFVPRPLFIEEHGLRLLLDKEGVGVELSRSLYEVGEWADAIEEAWLRGRTAKERKRLVGETGMRKKEGEDMARRLVDWVEAWKTSRGR